MSSDSGAVQHLQRRVRTGEGWGSLNNRMFIWDSWQARSQAHRPVPYWLAAFQCFLCLSFLPSPPTTCNPANYYFICRQAAPFPSVCLVLMLAEFVWTWWLICHERKQPRVTSSILPIPSPTLLSSSSQAAPWSQRGPTSNCALHRSSRLLSPPSTHIKNYICPNYLNFICLYIIVEWKWKNKIK